jgi:hypothetical protein
MNRITHRFLIALLFAVSYGALADKADAQVVVYHVQFQKSGSSINFSFFDEAFFVAEGLGGSGSFIFAHVENGRDFYTVAEDSGEFFFATKPGTNRAVMRASADTNTALSHYLALGDLDGTVTMNQRGQHISFNVASCLEGHVLASDPETDEEFAASDGSIGFAGMASMKAQLDRGRTDEANAGNLTVAQTVLALIDELDRKGFEDSAAEDGGGDGGDGDGTGDGDTGQTGTVSEENEG